ncbi:MAG: serine hydrolase domain-containing protein [Pseudomonadota bacterium]
MAEALAARAEPLLQRTPDRGLAPQVGLGYGPDASGETGMRRCSRALFAVLVAIVTLGVAAGPAAAQARLSADQPIPHAELAAFVDGLVGPAIARDHIAGATVAIVQDGQVVFKRGYGMASLSPQRAVDADRTMFRIGSISKTFTWIAIMRQVEAGRMRLDAPIDTYLPERLRTGPGPQGRPILVRDLMDHSPGFEDRIFGVIFERDAADVRALDDWLEQERPRRVRAPGELSSYSNYGVALAGAALAHVTGQEFERHIEAAITEPLGLRHTTFREPRPARPGLPAPLPADLASDVSKTFFWNGVAFEQRGLEHIGQVAPAGAASASAADMARYMLLILGEGTLDGVTVYGPAAAEAFRTPVRPAPYGRAWLHGFYERPLPGGLMGFGHDGGTTAFLSHMTLVPRLRLGVFISTNTLTGARLQAELAPALVRQFYAADSPFPAAPSKDLLAEARRFKGHYLQSRRAADGLEGFVHRLVFGVNVGVTPAGYLTMGGLGGARAFAPVGDPSQGHFVDAQTGAPLDFVMRDGVAAGIPIGAATLERVAAVDTPTVLSLAVGLAALASVLTLIGLGFRPRTAPIGPRQALGGWTQTVQAALWLAALAAIGVYLQSAADQSRIVYDWPAPALIAASGLALAASLATLVSLVLLPFIWREGGWTWRRKAAFSVTAAISLVLAALLLRWGFLAPWSS